MKKTNLSKRDIILETIRDMEPHIYWIGEDCYYLGQMVCRKCLNNEIELYSKLVDEYSRLISLSNEYELKEFDCKIIIEYYSQMISVKVDAYQDDKYKKIMHQRNELLFGATDKMLTYLIEQCNMYEKIIRWYRGIMY